VLSKDRPFDLAPSSNPKLTSLEGAPGSGAAQQLAALTSSVEESCAGAEPSERPESLARKPADEQGYELRNLRVGEGLERLACDEIDRLFGHDAAILGLDVAYLVGDLLENGGIEKSLHLNGGSSTYQNNVSKSLR
jgi:hypothetical protein